MSSQVHMSFPFFIIFFNCLICFLYFPLRSLLSKFLTESPLPPANGDTSDVSLSSNRNVSLVLDKGLTLAEIAHRTPGYEAGDLVRLILQLRIALLSAADNGMDTDVSEGTLNSLVTRDVLEVALSQVVPAAKNTSEFVTIPEVTWSDVGGLEETKTHLYNRFMLLVDDWERAQTLRRRSGGVLLEGPPGCGKTLIAKALSNTAGLNFLSVKGPEILNKYQGESERRVREIFERARACQPCLVFFDEIDAICPRRDGDESSGSRVSVVNQLLVELDGIDKHRQARVFVVGATNRKDMIDEAVLRPGRLGLHLFISPPASASDRASVLSACTRGATAPLIEGGLTALNRLAEDPRTNNMTGADLENLLDLAKQNAQLAKRDFVKEADLQAALDELKGK
uniref:Nuclear valosin-containing protein-like n=1 Tax=Schistocephalus solidus TaxID=70667 RepID=A0A0X3NKD8_SCHSO